MPFEVSATLALFLGAGLFALWRGGAPEKYAAAIMASWLVASVGYARVLGPPDFGAVEPAYLVLDSVELAAVLLLSLHANRMWPLWAAAAQLICVSGHLAALVEPGGMRRAYWVMTQIPPFIQIIALTLGVAAHHARKTRIGPYRSWRGRPQPEHLAPR